MTQLNLIACNFLLQSLVKSKEYIVEMIINDKMEIAIETLLICFSNVLGWS